jgi:hypothetical protein
VTGNRREKRLARERREQLGCDYATALRQVRAEYEEKLLARTRALLDNVETVTVTHDKESSE